MDVTVAFILKSWALMSALLFVMGFGITFLTIKVGGLIDKWIEDKKKKRGDNK